MLVARLQCNDSFKAPIQPLYDVTLVAGTGESWTLAGFERIEAGPMRHVHLVGQAWIIEPVAIQELIDVERNWSAASGRAHELEQQLIGERLAVPPLTGDRSMRMVSTYFVGGYLCIPILILGAAHTDELKAKVLVACDEAGASISGVALAHGLNTNLVRKWRSGRGVKRVGMAITPARAAPGATAEFIAIEMPASPRAAARAGTEASVAAPIGEPLIQIELRRGPLHLTVRWPTAAAEDCRAWLSELSSGLLK